MFAQIKTIATKNKSVTILCGMLLLLFLISLPLLLSNNSGSKQVTTPAENSSAITPSVQTKTTSFNPLIDNREIDRIQNAYQEQDQKSGQKTATQSHYKIHLELSPSPQSNKSSLLPIEQSYAGGCSVSGINSMFGYTLMSHFGFTDAQDVASAYGFGSTVMSEVPMEDGKNFAYYFSNAGASSFLQLAEPSGASQYHIATPGDPPNASIIQTDEAQKKADDTLVKYKLSDNNGKVIATRDGATRNYVFTYPKKYGSLPLIDLEAIKEAKGALCGLSQPKIMGYEEVRISEKGTIAKVINEARTVTGKYSLKTESFVDAVKEYGDNLPTDPILVSGSLGTSTDIGIKTIGDSLLTYFDYGDNYAQLTYIPVYLAKATTTTGASIIAVVPAVSKAEIDKTPLGAVIESRINLQLQTFIPAPPVSSTKPPNGCYGHLVDYRISCSDDTSHTPLCNTFISINSDHDRYGVCGSGCQNKTESIKSNGAGASVCNDAAEFLKGNTPTGNKSYVCKINGCPC